jgi:homoserine acetyltransferase
VQAAMIERKVDSTYLEIATPAGHDAFLIDFDLISKPVSDFLATL